MGSWALLGKMWYDYFVCMPFYISETTATNDALSVNAICGGLPHNTLCEYKKSFLLPWIPSSVNGEKWHSSLNLWRRISPSPPASFVCRLAGGRWAQSCDWKSFHLVVRANQNSEDKSKQRADGKHKDSCDDSQWTHTRSHMIYYRFINSDFSLLKSSPS